MTSHFPIERPMPLDIMSVVPNPVVTQNLLHERGLCKRQFFDLFSAPLVFRRKCKLNCLAWKMTFHFLGNSLKTGELEQGGRFIQVCGFAAFFTHRFLCSHMIHSVLGHSQRDEKMKCDEMQ